MAMSKMKEARWKAVLVDPSSSGRGQVMALQSPSIKEGRVAQH